nr:rho GDP-dissociation inhibitor 1-like [Ipomoea batatas]
MESGEKKAAEEMESMDNESDGGSGRMIRPPSEASLCPTEDEEDFTPMGPKCSIKEHLIKDKDDESLKRWKEQLLGSADMNAEVMILLGLVILM